jgi:hypothetical protein
VDSDKQDVTEKNQKKTGKEAVRMKGMCDCADVFVQKCGVKDLALLKICLCAVGIMIGLLIPEKKRKGPLTAAGFVFVFSYILLMAKFIKTCMDER